MLHVGLDLSRRRLDYLALTEVGERLDTGAAPPDADGLRGLAARLARHGEPICAAIESMNGARFVHDTLERCGWEVDVADAQKVKGLAPLACKTDRIDAWVLAELSRLGLVPAIWLPDPEVRAERERARWRLYLVRQRVRLKQRVHSTLMAWGTPCPLSDLFGARGRELLERLELPEPWLTHVATAVSLINDLDREITAQEREPRRPLPAGLPVGRLRPARPAVEARPPLPALGARRGGGGGMPPPALPRALRAHQVPPRAPARTAGRPGRARASPRARDLAHAGPRRDLRSQRRSPRIGRLTARK
jgi:Transposase